MSRRSLMYVPLFAGLALAALVAGEAASQTADGGTSKPAVTATYVGSQACAKCHEDQAEAFQKNVHHQVELDAALVGGRVGCESCHGPGSAHVAAEGDEDDPGFATVRNFEDMNAAEASEVCRTCHTAGDQFYWDHSTHARSDVSCQDCHSIHDPKSAGSASLLKASRPTTLCVKCHQDKHAELSHTAHMPLREGGMDCSDCHNPHGSPGPRMIRYTTANELCESCHADKRGPFLWEHPPVRENCTTCHLPHGSNNDKVLAAKRPFLCQRCHVPTRHPSTLYDLPDLSSNRLFNRSCTNCHSQIHGSNHPSGQTLLR